MPHTISDREYEAMKKWSDGFVAWGKRVQRDIVNLENYMVALPPDFFHDKRGKRLPGFKKGKRRS